jgi:hypothetical protein
MCLNEMYVYIGKHLSAKFPVQSGLKQDGTHQLLVYADVLGDNILTIKKNAEILTDASKAIGLEVNAEKT